MSGFLPRMTSVLVSCFARVVTGVRPEWREAMPSHTQRVYFANHASHGDFVLIWTVLPPEIRSKTRPVAAADYWGSGDLRRFASQKVFRSVLIERLAERQTEPPLETMARALAEGDSLILFPEGTRNLTDAPLLPFRSGLYNLALKCPSAEMVPVWIDNLSRVLPKGEFMPLPLLCSVTFGKPLLLGEGEERRDFLVRAQTALLALRPHQSEGSPDV